MGLKKAFKSWFLTEVSEIKETVGDMTDKAESALRKRERDLKSTSEERLKHIQDEGNEDDPFSEARDKIDAKVAEAQSREDLSQRDLADAARQEVEDAETYAKRVDQDKLMNEARAKAALDEAKAAERLAQIRKEMGTDS